MAATHVSSGSQVGVAQSTRSCSITPSGSNRKAFVAVFWYGAQTITAITYNAVDISAGLIITQDDNDTGNGKLRVYQVDDPAATTQTASVTWSAATTGECGISAHAYQDCGTVRGVASAAGYNTTLTTNITSSATDLVVSVGYAGYQNTDITVGAGQTARVEHDNISFGEVSYMASDETGSTTTTASYTVTSTGSSRWVIGALSIQEVAAGATYNLKSSFMLGGMGA